MMVEAGLVEKKRGEEVLELLKSKKSRRRQLELLKSKKSRRRQKKAPAMPALVQELFLTCKEVFAHARTGFVPSEADVERLKSVLDRMAPSDVGLSPDMQYFNAIDHDGAPPITYIHLYACEKFSICIFCLPPNAVLPLHNHPGMTVFNKILLGSMHIKSFDWAEPSQCDPGGTPNPSHFWPPDMRLAQLKADTVYTAPCSASILYPASGGNMHRFTAVTSCAFLDVLGPPYSDAAGRHCTYYHEYPYESFSGDEESMAEGGEGYAWLEEQENAPLNFIVVGAQYEGPKIIDNL